MEKFLVYSSEVKDALEHHKPIVALESTIISHGMPYPQNFETAKAVEDVVRQNGAIPATIAILDGQIHVGCSSEELNTLAKTGPAAIKCSRRDLAFALALKKVGATTVAGTMNCANKAGISVFVTGGLGGVHRGAEKSLDISADLTELGRTPVAVVSAGVKSVLDIPLTIEYLETQGVPVITFGSKTFPAFFHRESGMSSHLSLYSVDDVAAVVHTQFDLLKLSTGMVIAVPIPEESVHAGDEIEAATEAALIELKEKGIDGKSVTPFLLKRINEITEGKSLTTNIALVKNNAMVGSKIAVELAKIRNT